MFADLKERAKLKASTVKAEDTRKKEVEWLLRSVVEEALHEIESLGFINVKLYKYDSIPSFTLRIQARRGYSESPYTHNMELNSIYTCINYGCGANSSKGLQMGFDYNWNNSKLIATMKSALRALVGQALNSLEHNNAKGWNKKPGEK